jgi:putative glutamine amidotransferase
MNWTMSERTRPVIGIACCRRDVLNSICHLTRDAYVSAVCDLAGGNPVLIPAVGALGTEGQREAEALVERLDGLLLPGDPTNIAPEHYQQPDESVGSRDPARDATTLPLVRAAVADDLPVFGICRGAQEINVALGGTLHQQVHRLPGRLDHRAPPNGSLEEKFTPAHGLIVRKGGWLERLAIEARCELDQLRVNSLHAQAVDRMADGLELEGWAPDGTAEAFRSPYASFVVGVQWHAEWPVSVRLHVALLSAFGDACRARSARRSRSL